MESSDHNKKKLKKQLENKSSLKLQALLIMMTQQLCSKNLLLFKKKQIKVLKNLIPADLILS